MDEKRWDYYREIGYDEDLAKSKRETEGFWGIYQYWKLFEVYAVERLLSENQNCMIDFGADYSAYEDPALFERVRQILDPYPYVILLLPSADLNELIQILNERNEHISDGTLNINEHFIKHNSNYELAKFTIYTKDKAPDETRNEIWGLL